MGNAGDQRRRLTNCLLPDKLVTSFSAFSLDAATVERAEGMAPFAEHKPVPSASPVGASSRARIHLPYPNHVPDVQIIICDSSPPSVCPIGELLGSCFLLRILLFLLAYRLGLDVLAPS